MKKILILGAGNAQYDAIKYCKEKGYEVHALSYTNTDKSIPLCDYFEQINIVDIDKVFDYAKKINADLVYSVGSDIAMPTVTKVSELLGKGSFVSYDTALICNTKNLLRENLGNDFDGNVRHFIITSEEELEKVNFFPVIMKPVDSQGQRGVVKCSTIEELKENYEKSMSYSRQKKLIVEEFISGYEISVNCYMYNGKLIYSLISDRISFENLPGGIIKEHIVPSRYEGTEVENKVRDLCSRVLKKLEINNGPAYFQIMVSEIGKPYLIEVTPRLDGCHMWNLINYYDGVNLLELTFNHLLFNEIPKINKNNKHEPMKLHFMCQEPNTEFILENFEEKDKSYPYKRWYYENGDNVRPLNGYMEKCGYYIE